jgi:hypothetical protein
VFRNCKQNKIPTKVWIVFPQVYNS